MATQQQQQEPGYLEYYKINPTFIVLWRQLSEKTYNNRFDLHSPLLPDKKKTTYQGEITPHSRRRLNKAIQLLLDITEPRWIINTVTRKRQKFHLAFWTLTLSAPQYFIPDSQIKKELLEPFLRKMRKRGLKNYIWKAELQKNGNIHFHLLTDFFIEYTVMRDAWNNCQNRLGFITQFERKHGHKNPNSTDVKALKNQNGIAQYLSKYMLKPSDKQKQQKITDTIDLQRKGKVWDCSLNLKIKNQQYDFLTDNLYFLLHRLESQKLIRSHHEEFFKLFFLDKKQRQKLIPPEFQTKYNSYLNAVKSAG